MLRVNDVGAHHNSSDCSILTQPSHLSFSLIGLTQGMGNRAFGLASAWNAS